MTPSLELLFRIAVGCFSLCAAVYTFEYVIGHVRRRDNFGAGMTAIVLWLLLVIFVLAAWYWDTFRA